MSQIERLRGGGLDSLFPRDWDSKEPALLAMTPWKSAGGQKDKLPFDRGLVAAGITHPERHYVGPQDLGHLALRATQPSVTRAGVQHYMSDEYRTTGGLYRDAHQLGNQTPMVYHREDGVSLLLSGHHRATAALLADQPFNAIHVHGPFGQRER